MWGLVLFSLLAAAPQGGVELLDGESIAGEVASVSAAEVVVRAADGERRIPTSDVLSVSVGAAADSSAGHEANAKIELVDGSVLRARSLSVEGNTAQIQLAGGASIEVPTRSLSSARFGGAKAHDAAWQRIASGERAADVLVVRVQDSIDFLEGIIGDINEDAVKFTVDGDAVNVKWPKIEGLIYFRPDRPAASEKTVVVADRWGSRFIASNVELADAVMNVSGASGWKLEAPAQNFTRIDYSSGKIVYLSDLEPERVTYTPYLSAGETPSFIREFFAPKNDRAIAGGPLSLGGKTFARGVSVHSRTEVVYRLPEKFADFRAVVGIDDAARSLGAVQLSIYADDRKLFDEPISGAAPPRELSLKLDGANRLRIVVDFGEGRDESDHLDLCNARMVK